MSCDFIKEISLSNLICTSIAQIEPILRVHRCWNFFISGLLLMIVMIWFSTSAGSDVSSNSLIDGSANSIDTFMIKILTSILAMGSNIRQFSPKNIAPLMPRAVPIEENASER